MMEKSKKTYESTKNYNRIYNSNNINVQLDRNLIKELRSKMNKDSTTKSFIEELIKNYLKSNP